MMDERRRSERTDLDEIAYISASGSSTRCRVVNISEDGAALEVPDAKYVPSCFHLMTQQDRVIRSCRVVWIKQNRIGVKFDQSLEEQPPVTPRDRQFLQHFVTANGGARLAYPEAES